MSADQTEDYGADPMGGEKFKMVPSGDIVDFEERVARTANTINDLLLGKDVTPPTKAEEDEMTDHIAEFFTKEQVLIYKKAITTNAWMDIIKKKPPIAPSELGD